ncbi:hypothetical protein E2P81_ATG09128 [Venturia nashicola]|nr:hypothetical protein E2P81_ATG09128 [Venturia nashicola]
MPLRLPCLPPRIPCPRAAHASFRLCGNQSSTFSTFPAHLSSQPTPEAPIEIKPLNARWLNNTKARLGKCITFGLTTPQVQEAGSILKELATEWRTLVAGSEGFLTAEGRRGLWNHAVVWGEMDSMVCHINNVIYNRYAESARVNWTQNFASSIDPLHAHQWKQLGTNKGIGMILRSITTHFKFPMTYPDHITVLHKLATQPTASTDHFVLDVIIFSERHQRVAARLVEDIVVYDYVRGKKVVLEPFMVEGFRQVWREQEGVRSEAGRRIMRIEERIREIEKASWDRVDAVEDLGSST